jgi:dipeptidyl aminopeptidase/acylaminoacyl peptidase
MRTLKKLPLTFLTTLMILTSCSKEEELNAISSKGKGVGSDTNSKSFQLVQNIEVPGGEEAAEISAFDPSTNKLFTVNSTIGGVSVYDISDLSTPVPAGTITGLGGAPTSVASNNEGVIAVAVEADPSQNPGSVLIYDAATLNQIGAVQVGSLPDMVTFTPDGTKILVANEGEPSDDWQNDPEGSVSIIDYPSLTVNTADFSGFSFTPDLENNGFRVFGPQGFDLSLQKNVEPEFIAVSDDSRTAWVSLQENNGLAKIDIQGGRIVDILPLGFKDYNDPFNSIDPNDRDDIKSLRTVPAFGMYQPDGIAYANIKGLEIIVTANEGDARDYDAFSEEERIEDIELDEMVFGDVATLLQPENLGERLEITNTLGDFNNDEKFEELYSFGARSFSIWSGNGELIYDSGNDIAMQTLRLTPDRFNDDDGRSDAKGAEPESVAILQLRKNKWLLFVGLERNDQVLVYDISNPYRPRFLQILSNIGVDEAPEGLLVVTAEDSPTGKPLLIVSNEDSGTVSIYQNGDLDL